MGSAAVAFQEARQARENTPVDHNVPSTAALSSRPTLSPTTTSTLQPGGLVQDDLENLDQFDDNASQATSVDYLYKPGEDVSGLKVVQLEDVAKEHEPFECPYCFKIIQAQRQRSWRKHVFSDLRAYACVFEDCEFGLFEERSAWQEHELEQHRRQWICQRCKEKALEKAFKSKHTLLSHVRESHRLTPLLGELLLQIAEVSSQSVVETNAECHFCDELNLEAIRRARQMGREVPNGQDVMIPVEEFQKHIASHQEQLALFAIPQTIERSVDSGSRPDQSEADADEREEVSRTIATPVLHDGHNDSDRTRLLSNGERAFH